MRGTALPSVVACAALALSGCSNDTASPDVDRPSGPVAADWADPVLTEGDEVLTLDVDGALSVTAYVVETSDDGVTINYVVTNEGEPLEIVGHSLGMVEMLTLASGTVEAVPADTPDEATIDRYGLSPDGAREPVEMMEWYPLGTGESYNVAARFSPDPGNEQLFLQASATISVDGDEQPVSADAPVDLEP